MNKKMYLTAFKMLLSQRELENKLDLIGMSFEYGEGAIGTHFEKTLNCCETIIKEAIGFHVKHKPACVKIDGHEYQTTVDILYKNEVNDEFTITEDDFCEFFCEVINTDDEKRKEELINLFWHAIVDESVEAKEKFNSNFQRGLIGTIK